MRKLLFALMMIAVQASAQVVQYGQIVNYNKQTGGGVNLYLVYF